MPQSLTLFCKEHDLPKATVYRDCKQLGIDTSNGLDDEAIARLKLEYGIEDKTENKPEPAAVEPAEAWATGVKLFDTAQALAQRDSLVNRLEEAGSAFLMAVDQDCLNEYGDTQCLDPKNGAAKPLRFASRATL